MQLTTLLSATALAALLGIATSASRPSSAYAAQTTPTTPSTQSKDLGTDHKKDTDGILATWLLVGNNNEIVLAQLAEQKATNPEVKEFARKMVEEHRALGQKLDPFASTVGFRATGTPGSAVAGTPATGTPARPQDASFATGGLDHVALLQELGDQCLQSARKELEQKSGAEFDRCFMGMAIGAHMKANDSMTVFQRHASSDLKNVISSGQKTVAMHLEHAKELAKTLEGKM